MRKSGQVTLFVVLGIVIVAAIALGLYLAKGPSGTSAEVELSEREKISSQESVIASMIDDCVMKVSEEAIFVISKNGGYYPPRKDYLSYKPNNTDIELKVPLYLSGNKENIPSKKDLIASLEMYIDRNLPICLNELEGFEIIEPPKSQISIDNTMKTKVNMPIKLESSKLKTFFSEIDVSYFKTFKKVEGFYNFVKVFNGSIAMFELLDYAEEKNINYFEDTKGDASIYFALWDNYLNKKQLIFPFGVKKTPVEEVITPIVFPEAEDGANTGTNPFEPSDDDNKPQGAIPDGDYSGI